MRIHLGSRRTFWSLIGAGFAGVVLLGVLWAWPQHQAAVEAENAWRLEALQARTLRSFAAAGKIPSRGTLQDRAAYRTWLDQQADNVRKFFEDRMNVKTVLEAPLTGKDNPAPDEFKEQYIYTLRKQRMWLEQNRRLMSVPDVRTAFPAPRWVSTEAFPDPKRYDRIRRGYWSYYYLYQRFLAGGVRRVKKLRVARDPRPLSADNRGLAVESGFLGLDIEATVALPPEKVTLLLRRLVNVPQSAEPLIRLTEVTLRAQPYKAGSTPLCDLVLRGHFVLVKPRSGEN